jgi:hypothetical protein
MRSAKADLARLEELAHREQIRIITSRHLQRGGHCVLRGRPLVLVASHLSDEEKVELLRRGLCELRPDLAQRAEMGEPN